MPKTNTSLASPKSNLPKGLPKKKHWPAPIAVHYRVLLSRPEAHLLTVECCVPNPSPDGESFALPAWIPGSYLIRDFARHIVSMSADVDGHRAPVKKIAVDQWQVPIPKICLGKAEQLTIRIEVYAWDLSVRGAHLDTHHAFFNGSSLFLRALGRESHACNVTLERPEGDAYLDWRVATALPRAGTTERYAFGRYQAPNYAELIDHPVEMGRFDLIDFNARGVHHDFALTGTHRADLNRLRQDVKKICAWQLDFWGKPYPAARYVFLTTCVGQGYGGLEHRASTALICSRQDLPKAGERGVSESYRKFLGLVSHEYFHTWWVKRVKPIEFAQSTGLDLQKQNPTELLWVFEGFTSYYDDLALLRCGLISASDYLVCLAKTIGDVHAAPGRFRQSVADASFDAWIKYYKPDENSPNAQVSYYAKGALIALALDLMLRESSAGKHSLDDLMRRVWREHGQTGLGVSETHVRAIAAELAPKLAGKPLDQFFSKAVHGTADLALKPLLARHGIDLRFSGGGKASLGIKLKPDSVNIACAFEGGAAQRAGLSGEDILIALDGIRLLPGKVDAALDRYHPGDTVEIHAFRRDELRSFKITLDALAAQQCKLSPLPKVTTKARSLRARWLGSAKSAQEKTS